MANLTSEFKASWLRRQKRQAAAASPPVTLLAQLEAQQDSLVDAIASGQVIASTSGNNHTVSFSKPGDGASGPDRMAELTEEMIRRYGEARTNLIEEQDVEAPTDDQIFDEILEHLNPVRTVENDYTDLRVAGGATI